MNHVPEAAATNAFAPSVDDLRSLDPDAWEQLYVQVRPTLWRFARARLASADQAEDAVSETMVRAMSAISRYRDTSGRRGSGGVLGWLLGIERNVINEVYRSGRRLRAVPVERDVTAPESADGVVAADEVTALRLAFARLPDDDRELLELRVVARMDADTTGRVLGKRPGAVRMAQARALGRLRVTLSEGDRE